MLKRIDDVLPPDTAWEAVSARDRSSDGKFVFAVRTTGIFCRPSCPAKRPNRDNVEFFLSAEEALAAGYRACKRCDPEGTVRTLGEKRVREAAKYIEKHASETISLDALGVQVKLSPFHLQREFKKIFGLTPRAYQSALRVGTLKSRLATGESVSRATYEAGFGSSRAVYETATKAMGMTPGEFRRAGAGKQIRFIVGESAVGTILLAATDRGICWVSIGDSAQPLERDLAETFSGATITVARPGDRQIRGWLASVTAIAAGRKTVAPPLDVAGTAFQLKVWEALRKIPAGATRTYSEVAAELGSESSSRAVGSACGRNPVSLLIPCHRVLRADGELGGYRWGIERKEKLLAAEKGKLKRS
ncbi:MAG: bifunctional DNA-binding transcriptional regulator/O6-methylguanine-DNA methyltransferase Ada [Gemmatimonadota bacterium]|nr:bifunctional DNA-binding transcriptional regulator/O6-methylguanine-DNA methyltransferase Ada [Gemmatimonadota bacterium]